MGRSVGRVAVIVVRCRRTCLLTHSLTHSPTHSLTHPPTQPPTFVPSFLPLFPRPIIHIQGNSRSIFYFGFAPVGNAAALAGDMPSGYEPKPPVLLDDILKGP